MKPPFTLIPGGGSEETTVECLRALLRRAESGEILGLAYCAMLKRRNFTVNAIGEAYRSPTFTRGMVAALDDYLAQMVRTSL